MEANKGGKGDYVVGVDLVWDITNIMPVDKDWTTFQTHLQDLKQAIGKAFDVYGNGVFQMRDKIKSVTVEFSGFGE